MQLNAVTDREQGVLRRTVDSRGHGASRCDGNADPVAPVLCAAIRDTGSLFELARSKRAARRGYADRWVPSAGGDPGGFTYKQRRTNLVMRWEYRPGSTLFAAWQQGCTQDGLNEGTFDTRRDCVSTRASLPTM